MTSRPDILYIMSDQHAQKITGCYGDPLVRTPNIDALARRGVVFDNAYCPSPLCVPSRMSALTGRWPSEQGCWTLQDMLGSDVPTWAHALGAAGYRTILVGRLHAIGPDQLHGFAERHVGEPGANWLGVARQDLGVLAGAQGPAPVSLQRSGRGQSAYQLADMAATDTACERLAELSRDRARGEDRPFCLTLGLLLPHCPFVAWNDDYDLYDGKVGLPAIVRPDPASEHPWIGWWRRDRGIDDPDPADVIRARTAYYGLVTRTDLLIGKVLEALEAHGLAQIMASSLASAVCGGRTPSTTNR
jgi:choline-sulfatase